MASTGYTPILLYASGTATNVPLAANLTSSASGAELALNYADGKLYFKNSSGVVTLLSASGGGPAGGSNTQVQFNSSGVLAGSASFTWDGTTLVTPSHTTNTATTGSTNKGPLNYGTLSFSDTGIVQSAQTSVNSYFQNVIQNTSAGTAASAEFIAYNDQGTASTNYATVGINSSGYTGTGSINAPGYAYFLSASTDLVLGTIGANGIHFTINSSATDALAISSAGAVSLPGGTANGVAYLNGSKVVTTGSALTFDGTNLGIGLATPSGYGISPRAYVQQTADTAWKGLVIGAAGSDAFMGLYYDGSVFNYSASYGATAGYKPMAWQVNGSEQMRLTSTGLGIGTSSFSGYRLNVKAAFTSGIGGAYIEAGEYNQPIMVLNHTNGSVSANLFQVQKSGTGVLTLDSSGNLGLGVTPSAWGSGSYKGFQIGGSTSLMGRAGGSDAYFMSNTYFDQTNYRYVASLAAAIYSQSGGTHNWFTAPSGTAGNAITFTQAMTLSSGGVLSVGTTGVGNRSAKFYVRQDSTTATVVEIENEAATGKMMSFTTNGESEVGTITFTAAGVLYNVTSDRRLKTNIIDAPEGNVDAIKVRSFDWVADGSHQVYGVVAQELLEVAPYAVSQPAKSDEMMGVDYSKLVPMLVKEIQDLRKRLAAAGI